MADSDMKTGILLRIMLGSGWHLLYCFVNHGGLDIHDVSCSSNKRDMDYLACVQWCVLCGWMCMCGPVAAVATLLENWMRVLCLFVFWCCSYHTRMPNVNRQLQDQHLRVSWNATSFYVPSIVPKACDMSSHLSVRRVAWISMGDLVQ